MNPRSHRHRSVHHPNKRLLEKTHEADREARLRSLIPPDPQTQILQRLQSIDLRLAKMDVEVMELAKNDASLAVALKGIADKFLGNDMEIREINISLQALVVFTGAAILGTIVTAAIAFFFTHS